ncbi:MAG: DUF6056 family protein [Butyricicoccus sp.]|nr:DUF6056 family protein [Butyricicoccus sp.]
MRMRTEGERRCPDPELLINLFLFFAAFMALLLLTAKITLYCDDYFYGLFFRDGLSGFWELTKWHYLNFNGRAFVHFLAELALVFDTKLFIFLNPLMLAAAFAVGGRLQSGETPWPVLLAACAAGMMGVLALPVRYLNTSILWISASFNYLFPIFFLMLVLRRYRSDMEKSRLRALTMLLIFLAGATTEQSGLAAVACLGGWGALSWLRKKIPFRQGVLPALLSGAGYVSVIFAPGTWVRVENEQSGGFLAFLTNKGEIVSRTRLCLSCFTGEDGLPLLFVLFCFLLAVHVLVTRRSPKIMLSSAAAAALYLLLRHGEHYFLAAVLSVLFYVFVSAACLLREETALRGLLLLGMLATQLVMVLNSASSPRTTVPAVLLLLIVCASLAAECLEKLPRWGVTALAAAAVLALLPFYLSTYQGYAANAKVNAANGQLLRRHDGEPLVLDLNLDDDYRHYMYYDSMAYLDYAAEYYGITDEKISYTSGTYRLSGIYNGEKSGIPACEEGGKLYLPIQNSVCLLGGNAEWDFRYNGVACRLDGAGYLFCPNGEIYVWDPELGQPGELAAPHSDMLIPWYTCYASAEQMQQLFGFALDYNGEENIYYIYREEQP